MNLLAKITVAAAILFAATVYTKELRHSPLLDPHITAEQKYIAGYLNTHSPDIAKERQLAKAYWLRYEDVRLDHHWGEKARMGIWGPRDHYMLHGRREGRIFQPLIVPQDLDLEKKLAASYWRHYPPVRRSSVWGENSALGILGPRDHYTYIGRFQNLQWGLTLPPQPTMDPEHEAPARKHN